jgi:predicted AlkP superfamily phosphohydrolase/phosphomutase
VLELHDALPGPSRLLAVADHGFAPLRAEVDLNAWLREQGLLRAAPEQAAHELDASALGPDTAAFALDPGRIYLHTRQRFGRGRLDAAEAAALARDLRAALAHLTWQGEPVMEEVRAGAELYHGPLAERAPDLVCTPRPGFDLKAKFDRARMFDRFHRHGAHTAGDVFFYDSGAPSGPPVQTVREAGQAVAAHFGLDRAQPPTLIEHA